MPADGDGGEGADGTLTLVVQTTGDRRADADHRHHRRERRCSRRSAPTCGDPTSRSPATSRRSASPVPLKPTRCDAHAFAESGGATAFKIGLHLDGEPGQITLRMSPTGAANAITFARASCGMLTSVTGGEG